jgi:hypothetical protein
MSKVDEVHSLSDTVRILSNKVQRLEYGKDVTDIRRKD